MPQDWKDGGVVELPEKGDFIQCLNWKGIVLLSIPGKILATVMLNRTDKMVDEKLLEEQTGFCPGRSSKKPQPEKIHVNQLY